MLPEQFAHRRPLIRRIQMYLGGAVGLLLLWLASFGTWALLIPGAFFLALALGAAFMARDQPAA